MTATQNDFDVKNAFEIAQVVHTGLNIREFSGMSVPEWLRLQFDDSARLFEVEPEVLYAFDFDGVTYLSIYYPNSLKPSDLNDQLMLDLHVSSVEFREFVDGGLVAEVNTYMPSRVEDIVRSIRVVDYSRIYSPLRGYGFGVQLYTDLARVLARSNQRLYSSLTQTDNARKLWRRMLKMKSLPIARKRNRFYLDFT